MRLAGTCSKYSKSAMPQLTNAAMYHFRSARFLRCAYQANVMKMFDAQRSKLVFTRTGIFARRLREVLSLASRLAGFGRRAKRRGCWKTTMAALRHQDSSFFCSARKKE